ncbi:MAG: hypothetical protein NTY09_13115 [bacterium]|nr:hypothetical protein [bacterium]
MFSGFQNITRSVLISIFCVLLLIGCSSGGNKTLPVVPDTSQRPSEITVNSASAGQNTHYLLTYDLISIDATNPDDVKVEIIPARVGLVHINILKFLEFSPCTDCFKIVGISYPEPGKLNVDIEVTHPFDDMNFMAFDVRGIIMFNGSHVFPVSGLTMSDSTMGDGQLLNAEGFTRLYNGSTLDMAGDFFTYYQGKLATPIVPNADLNGFLRHITDDPANTRNALYAGDSVTRTYFLALPSTEFVLGYAVDASWDVPTADPVTDPMTQFPSTANCIEPWKIVVSDSNTIASGSTTLTIDIYDWQGKDTIFTVLVECPELFNGQVAATFIEIIPWFARYEAVISNDNDAPIGSYKALISVEAVENANSPEWTDLTAYTVRTIAYNGKLIWAKRVGGDDYESGNGITTLSDNSTVVTGYFGDDSTFGPGEPNETILNSTGDRDIVIARYNQDGSLAWVKQAGGLGNDYGIGITTLSDNSIVVTGYFEKNATFGPGEQNETFLISINDYGYFIARYNPDGSLAWAKQAGVSSWYGITGITTLSDNSTVVTGEFFNETTFGPGEPNETVLIPAGFNDIFIARYNPNGTLAWAKRAGGPGFDVGSAITALSDNSTVVTGYFRASPTFGSGEPNETILTSTGEYDIFIARYNPDGTLAWVKQAGGPDYDVGSAITALSDNSTVVTGKFSGSATFGPGEPNQTVLSSAGDQDIFIARYNPDGTLAWVKQAGGPGNDYGIGITTLSDNSIVVTGMFGDSATFGPGEPNQTALTSDGNWDTFIARYNSYGTLAWAKNAGEDYSEGITSLADNSTVVTGYFEYMATFGAGEPNETILNSAGKYDMFIARFTP